MLESDSLTLFLKGVRYASVFALAAFCYRLYQVRMLFRRVQRVHGVVSHVPIRALLWVIQLYIDDNRKDSAISELFIVN